MRKLAQALPLGQGLLSDHDPLGSWLTVVTTTEAETRRVNFDLLDGTGGAVRREGTGRITVTIDNSTATEVLTSVIDPGDRRRCSGQTSEGEIRVPARRPWHTPVIA